MRSVALAFATVVLVACAGPSTGPNKPQPTGSGGSTGTGGSGGGGTTGGGGSTGTGGNGGDADMGTAPAPGSDGGVPIAGVGCSAYVQCLAAAMSDADAMACDTKSSANAKTLLDAVDQCVGGYCLGMSGAAARCKQSATDGSMENLDGTPAFNATTGAPTGDCGACLLNGDAALYGEACQPTTDPACNTSKCAMQTAACQADK